MATFLIGAERARVATSRQILSVSTRFKERLRAFRARIERLLEARETVSAQAARRRPEIGVDAGRNDFTCQGFCPALQLSQVIEKHARMPAFLQTVQKKFIQEVDCDIDDGPGRLCGYATRTPRA